MCCFELWVLLIGPSLELFANAYSSVPFCLCSGALEHIFCLTWISSSTKTKWHTSHKTLTELSKHHHPLISQVNLEELFWTSHFLKLFKGHNTVIPFVSLNVLCYSVKNKNKFIMKGVNNWLPVRRRVKCSNPLKVQVLKAELDARKLFPKLVTIHIGVD